MKVNKKNNEQGIKKISLLASTIIILIVAFTIAFILIKTEYSNFRTHIKSFKNTLIQREEFNIKTSVENLKNDIKFEQLSIINNKKVRIKNQSIIAYNLAFSLYEKTKHLTNTQQISLIKSSIKQISQKDNDINYFIFDTKGTMILNSENQSDENENFLDFEDINGKKFINKMINSNTHTQNYIEYFWYKPKSSITAKKITFSKHLKELDLLIGSGSFIEKKNIKLTNNLYKKVLKQNINKETFIYIYKIDSLNDILNQNKLLVQKHIKTKKNEGKAIKELMINTNYKANDYLYYDNNQKLIYATFVEDLRYFIAFGVNLSSIYDIVEKEREISLKNMNLKIINVLIAILIMTIIFFIFSFYFTKRLELIFKRYKQSVIQNEEKYHLLFNHSNDAFIISSIKENSSKIISSNKTALKLTSYSKEQLRQKDFFELFIELKLENILENKEHLRTVQLKTKTNSLKTIELNTVTYAKENEKLLFASLRDITERTQLKEEKEKQKQILIQKSKMAAMGEMIGNIAHQWRQPLSQISGLFFDIESAYTFKELDKNYLSKRVNEANDLLEYMSKTIDDFRHFFNPNTKKENFSLIEAINNSLQIVSATLEYHQIKIEIQDGINNKILGYKNEFSQALVNIISNAKDILIDRKVLNPKVSIYIKDDYLCIEDNAGGIEDEIIEKIFDPYFTTKFEYGTGIGLYMTKIIIEEKMNSTIKVKNSKNGAIFSIKL